MNLTDIYVEGLHSLQTEKIPDSVLEQAKKCLMDYIGVTFAGEKVLRERNEKFLSCMSENGGNATVIGMRRKTSVATAALLNGLDAHMVELDDGHRFCIAHIASPVISALLPVVETEKLDADALLRGIVAGYEATVRIAKTVQPTHKQMGWHGTGTAGGIGAAVAVCTALKMSKAELKNAISAAVAGVSGLLCILSDGSDLKAFNAGKAAMNGVVSAAMARVGYTGPNDPVGGKHGFIESLSKENDPSQLERKPGDPFGIDGIYMKPYAACRYVHAPIQAALEVQAEQGIDYRDIESIRVKTFDYAVEGHDHTLIEGATSAKMSIPYGVAVALMTGRAGMEEYTPRYVGNKEVLSLTKKVKVEADDEMTSLTPGIRAASVEIDAGKGAHTVRVDYPRGEPENPLTAKDIEEKMIGLSIFAGKSEREAKKIAECVWNVESKLSELQKLI